MPQGSVIGNPCLQNGLMRRSENRKENRWAKRAPRLEGVADAANGKPLEPLSTTWPISRRVQVQPVKRSRRSTDQTQPTARAVARIAAMRPRGARTIGSVTRCPLSLNELTTANRSLLGWIVSRRGRPVRRPGRTRPIDEDARGLRRQYVRSLASRGHAPRDCLWMGRPRECVASRRSYCLSYTSTLVESGWPLADTPFDVTVRVLPSADSVFVPV